MPEPVRRAMDDASDWLVDMNELNLKAGRVIAGMTGAEAALVTAGSAAGMLLQAAACISGPDQTRAYQLPDTTDMKNEIVIHRGHRVTYDRCYQLAGATLVEIGRSKGTEEWELEAAITDRTAAVAYVFGPPPCGALSFERTVEIAHGRGVPVIVDAAAMLPPVENLTRYFSLGADMVSFSGGKGIQGPQSTGILAGRTDLIEAARLNAAPNRYGLGRMAKVSKEEIAGLVTALKLFLDTDQDAVMAEWRRKCMHIVEGLQGIPGVRAEVVPARPTIDDAYNTSDRAAIYFDEDYDGPSLEETYTALEGGEPSIRVRDGGVLGGIGVYPANLLKGDEVIVASRLREILTRRAQG